MSKIIIVCSMLVFLNAWCVNESTVEKKIKKEPQVTVQGLHHYFMANYYQFGGEMKKSYAIYQEMIKQDAPVYVYNGYIHLLNETQNYKHILQLIPQLEKLFAEDASLQLIFAQVLERSGKHDQADAKFIQLNDKFGTNQEIAFSAANSFLRRKEPENALHVIEKLLNTSPSRPNNFIFHFMQSQIYTQLSSDANASEKVKKENKVKALESVKKSLELHPKFDKGLLLSALLHEQAEDLENAIAGYTQYLEVSGSANREVEQHLLQLVFKQKIKQRDLIGNNNSITLNKQCFDNALELFEQQHYSKALEQIDNCLKEKPDDNESRLLKIQILGALKRPTQVAQLLKNWILKDPTHDMWYKTVHLLTQNTISIQQAIDLLKEIEKQHPHNILPILYLADLKTRGHYETQAIAYHEKALKLTTDDALKAKILYQMGTIYYENHNFNGLKKVISQTQQINAQFGPLLNLIAYYYVSHENDTIKAQKMLDLALAHDSNNPHFLDTQALIYYKQQKYNKALPMLEKIAQIVPSDYTILIHLAQTRYQSGDIDRAIMALDQAKRQAKVVKQKQECEQLLSQWKTKKA